MFSSGGTHQPANLAHFNVEHKALKTALNNNLKQFSTDYLRHHLASEQDYFRFKDLRRAITIWYVKGQTTCKHLFHSTPTQGSNTHQVQSLVEHSLHNIRHVRTLLQGCNKFIIAKAYRTVVLTYKHLSDGYISSTTPTLSHSWSSGYQSPTLLHSTPHTHRLQSHKSTSTDSVSNQNRCQDVQTQVNTYLDNSESQQVQVNTYQDNSITKQTQTENTFKTRSTHIDYDISKIEERLIILGWQTLMEQLCKCKLHTPTDRDNQYFEEHHAKLGLPVYSLQLRETHKQDGYPDPEDTLWSITHYIERCINTVL
jgi:hypothetical protein